MLLCAWVFALSASAANACVVKLTGSAAASSHEPHAHEGMDGHPHPDQPDAGKAGCQKFCTDESSALSKSGNPHSAQIPATFLMDGLKIEPGPTAEAHAGLSLECPSAHGPPLVICLLRLTL